MDNDNYHMATFADELKLSSIEIWQKILHHKFIMEIYNGILPIDKFVFYIKQDQIFLEEFCRFLSVAKQKSDNNADLVKLFDNILYSTINFEMKMQDQIIFDSFNISPSSVYITRNVDVLPSNATLEYTFYLRQVSSKGSISKIVSAMSPCPWTYLEIAEKLSKSHHLQNNIKIYKKWMEFYLSDESHRQVNELKKVLCILADDKNNKMAMKKHFASACNYEFLFWDMAYYGN